MSIHLHVLFPKLLKGFRHLELGIYPKSRRGKFNFGSYRYNIISTLYMAQIELNQFSQNGSSYK